MTQAKELAGRIRKAKEMTERARKANLEITDAISNAERATLRFIRCLARLSHEEMQAAGYHDAQDVLLAIRRQLDGLEKQIQKLEG